MLIEVIKLSLSLNNEPLVCCIFSPSQTETTPPVPSTTLGHAHSSHGIRGRNRDLGRQCRARVRVLASLSPGFAHQLHAKSRSAWCFCGIFLRGACLITRNKHSADDLETHYILLFCQPAFTMGDNSGLAAPPCVVVQVSPGRTHLRMD